MEILSTSQLSQELSYLILIKAITQFRFFPPIARHVSEVKQRHNLYCRAWPKTAISFVCVMCDVWCHRFRQFSIVRSTFSSILQRYDGFSVFRVHFQCFPPQLKRYVFRRCDVWCVMCDGLSNLFSANLRVSLQREIVVFLSSFIWE